MLHRLLSIITLLLSLSACSTHQSNTAKELMQAQEKAEQIERMEMQRAQEAARDEPKLLLTLIEENIEQNRYFAALAYIKSYKQNFGSPSYLLILHAHVLRNLNQDEEAMALYQQALNTDQKAEALHGLGLLAAKQQQFQQAITYLQEATTLNPTNAITLSDLGFAYLSLGNTQEARLPLGQAIELDPKNQRIIANTVLLLLMENKTNEAQALMLETGMSSETQSHLYYLSYQLLNETQINYGSSIDPNKEPFLSESHEQAVSKTHHIPLTSSQH